MRITIVQGAFLPIPPIRGGAVERVWHSMATEFTRAGQTVCHVSRHLPALSRRETVGGIEHRRVRGYDAPASALRYRICDLCYALRAKRALPPADILVTNSLWLPVLVRSERRGALCVHVARMPKGQMRLYRHAARLHAVSTAVAEAILEELPACGSKVKVIPNCLAEGFLATSGSAPGWEARPNIVAYAGRVHPEKGLALLIRAFELLEPGLRDRWRLVVLGPHEARLGGGGPEHLESLRALAQATGVRVEWLPPTFDLHELVQFYSNARVFVYPSLAERGESFGLAPLEAMACGCATVVSGLACFQDFLRSEENGLVFEHRTESAAERLRDGLRLLMSHPSLSAKLGQEAQLTARAFSPKALAQRYLCDFCELLRR